MITVHAHTGNRVIEQPLIIGNELPPGTVWIDMQKPDEAERQFLAMLLGIELPTREAMKEIEASSQLYVRGGCIYLTTPMISQADTPHPVMSELTFVLTPQHMISIRYHEPRSIMVFAARATRRPELAASADAALLGLLDAVTDRVADVLELIGGRIDQLSSQVFEDSVEASANGSRRRHANPELREVLRGIGKAGDLTHKVRESLAGLDRLVTFMASTTASRLTKEQKTATKTLARDLRSLHEHAGFLAHEAAFLLDATLGMINIEQNYIIKIFTVASVAFLPPTLIASIYGMNFRQNFPELDWAFGYPYALALMVLSALIPFLYFRQRGWL
ncbi:MAG: magnesium transporter CorA family protein [Rhodospirillaceae bacterium]